MTEAQKKKNEEKEQERLKKKEAAEKERAAERERKKAYQEKVADARKAKYLHPPEIPAQSLIAAAGDEPAHRKDRWHALQDGKVEAIDPWISKTGQTAKAQVWELGGNIISIGGPLSK